jgi:hypothetical protein
MFKFLPIILFSISASASLNFDFRMDYRTVNYNDDAASKNFSTFNVKTGRLDYQGVLSDDISFRTRIALNKDGANASGSHESGLQKAVEYAYVTHKLNDSLALTLGRYASDIGAFEGMTPGGDLYLVSAGFSGSGPTSTTLGASTATKVSASNTYLYITGAKLTYKLESQTISLMAANPVNVITGAGTDTAQSRLMTGAVYKGGFLDKNLNFVASYHSVGTPTTSTPGKDDNLNLIGIGVTYLFADNMLGFDSLMNTYKRNVGVDTRSEKSNSMIATYAYKGHETITPMLKYTQTTETPDSATSTNKTVVTGTSAVVEYKPAKDQIYRYHVAYSIMSDKTDGATGTPAQTEILAGMRINADFLK